jgi:hypothetical protein
MRFAPALAASLAALISACAQAPSLSQASDLTLTGAADDQAPAFLLEISGVTADRLTLAPRDARNAATAVGEPGVEPTAPVADPLRDEVRATVDFAGVAAFAAADAGLARDRAIAEQRAVELANAAALVAQRVNELHASTASGCADGEVVVDPAVDDAALFSALAAEAAGNIAGELNPPSQTVCSAGGCHSVCEEVPGTVDEIALGDAIDAATDAGAGCAATVEIL